MVYQQLCDKRGIVADMGQSYDNVILTTEPVRCRSAGVDRASIGWRCCTEKHDDTDKLSLVD